MKTNPGKAEIGKAGKRKLRWEMRNPQSAGREMRSAECGVQNELGAEQIKAPGLFSICGRPESALPTPHFSLGFPISRFPAFRFSPCAFTLIELLVVIAIIGLLAGLAAPVLHNFRPNYTASLTQQLLTDLARARQLAISQHTTVYMVFVPTNFYSDTAWGQRWSPADFTQATNLLDKQNIAYNFVSLHSMGDQPGRPTVHYLSSWKTLPEGGYIYPAKFLPPTSPQPVLNIYTNPPVNNLAFQIYSLNRANGNPLVSPTIPFPLENTLPASPRQPYIGLPYIAFDYMGRLVYGPPSQTIQDRAAIIPITRGSVAFSRDPNKQPRKGLPSFNEQPVGNTTNGYNLVYVDSITGRARALQQEVR